MKIWVEDSADIELIGESRETVDKYLMETASDDYRKTVMDWFDSPEINLTIMNGTEEEFWMKR